MADLVEVDRDRLHLWTFARAATGWPHSLDLARALAP
jgi:hypothetical protein